MVTPMDDEGIWEEFDVLERELGADVEFFGRTCRNEASQHWRRAYCRAVSAYFEAITAWMARYTVLFYCPGQLGGGERDILERRLSAIKRAFHALDLFTNTAGADSPLRRGSSQWMYLMRMIEIRNRLVHPKRSVDVSISDDDLRAVERAAGAVFYLFSESLGRCSRALLKRFDDAQQVWLQRKKSNKAMQPTPGRRTASRHLSKTSPLQLMLVLASGSQSCFGKENSAQFPT